eukprot:336025-Pelagomonas_calceolata.AAC.13
MAHAQSQYELRAIANTLKLQLVKYSYQTKHTVPGLHLSHFRGPPGMFMHTHKKYIKEGKGIPGWAECTRG